MKLDIVKLNSEDNVKITRGLIHFDNPACSVTIKDGNIDNNIIRIVKYLHVFEHFSLPKKRGNDLVYHCYNNDQVENIVKFLILREKMQKNTLQLNKTVLF